MCGGGGGGGGINLSHAEGRGGGLTKFYGPFFSNTERGAQVSDMQFSHCKPPLPVINDQSLIYENHFVIAC